jgi:AcrR family transcriptional regulator
MNMKHSDKPIRAPRPKNRVSSQRLVAGRNAPQDLRDAVMHLKRERIVAAALELFYHQGYARTTLEQVADSIQVTKPFIYQYFKSKNELLAEICSRGIHESHAAMNRAMDLQGSPTERLRSVAFDFMLAVLCHQANAVIYSREEKELAPADRDALNSLRREFDHRLVELLKEGVTLGEFQVEDLHLTALAIVGIVGWSQVWYRSGGRLTKEQASEHVASLVLAMVRAKNPKRKRLTEIKSK